MKNKYIVIGCSKLGNYIANALSMKGEDVVTIDKDQRRIDYLPITYTGLTYLGDGTDLEILEKADIKNAKCVLALTNDENTNIFIAHVCKVFYEVPNIIARVNSVTKSKLLTDIGIKTLSPFELSVEEIDLLTKRIK